MEGWPAKKGKQALVASTRTALPSVWGEAKTQPPAMAEGGGWAARDRGGGPLGLPVRD